MESRTQGFWHRAVRRCPGSDRGLLQGAVRDLIGVIGFFADEMSNQFGGGVLVFGLAFLAATLLLLRGNALGYWFTVILSALGADGRAGLRVLRAERVPRAGPRLRGDESRGDLAAIPPRRSQLHVLTRLAARSRGAEPRSAELTTLAAGSCRLGHVTRTVGRPSALPRSSPAPPQARLGRRHALRALRTYVPIKL